MPDASVVQVRLPAAVIGDVHGQYELLDGLLGRLAAAAPEHARVFLGDFVDRGPESSLCIERVLGEIECGRGAAVMGDHDLAFVRAAGLDGSPPSPWWRERYRDEYDSAPTLKSYLGRLPSLRNFNDDLAEVARVMPERQKRFLANLPWLVSTPLGDGDGDFGLGYLFLHAGLSRNLDLSANQQVAALVKKRWGVEMAKSGTSYFAKAHPEYPPWLGADRDACASPLPCDGYCQVTGHQTVPTPAVVGGFDAIRIDTSGGVWQPLTACLLDRRGGVSFVSYPEGPRRERGPW